MVVTLMLPPSGMPPEIIDAWTHARRLADALDDLVKAGDESAGGLPGSNRGETCTVSTFSGSKPGSIRISVTKLPMKSAAPTSSTTASATSRRRARCAGADAAADAAARAVLQRVRQIGLRQLQRGNDAEQESGHERQARGRAEHAQVDARSP